MTLPSPEEAFEQVRRHYPFQPLSGGSRDVHINVANTVRRYAAPGGRLLDFGAGIGTKTAMLQLLGMQCSAYDDLGDDWHQNEEFREQALGFMRDMGVDFHLAGPDGLPFAPDTFDVVMNHDVLEHLHDSPRKLLNDLVEVLKPGGLFYTTMPNAVNIRKRLDVLHGRTNLPRFDLYYWSPIPWRDHVREYTRDDLLQLARYLKLDVLELRGVDQMLGMVPAPLRGLYVRATNLVDGWKDSWSLVCRKPEGWRRADEPSEPGHLAVYNTHLYPGGNIDYAHGRHMD